MSSSDTPTQNVHKALHNPAREPVRILCIEDNDRDFVLIRKHIRDAGFSAPIEIQRARSMSEAGLWLGVDENGDPYDIVLLDLSLLDSHGIETYQHLRAAAPRIAVVVLSGNNDEELALELVQSGAQDYLPKDSLSPDLLKRCIVYAMKRQRHRVGMENLTERLRHTTEELKTTQMQLIQAEKIESLGRLASSVAHEVKNPLGVIQMGIDFLAGRLTGASKDIDVTLSLMQEAISRADSVIHDMLGFSRSDNQQMQSCEISDILDCVLRMIKHEVALRNITLRLDLAPPPLRTRCVPTEIQQVLINVLMNALQAMEKGKTLTLRTSATKIWDIPRDAGLRDMNIMRPGDDAIIIEVQDEGLGIPPENMSRVFEPFFTTKTTGEGTGLGLSVCKRIIELHRGHILVTNVSEPSGVLVRVILKAETLSETETKTPATE